MINKVKLAIGNVTYVDDGVAAFKAINEEDLRGLAIFKGYCRNVAIMIINIQTVVHASKFVIGGAITAQPVLIEQINNQ
ncbi:ROK family protein, partial [Lactobacillus helveticus]